MNAAWEVVRDVIGTIWLVGSLAWVLGAVALLAVRAPARQRTVGIATSVAVVIASVVAAVTWDARSADAVDGTESVALLGESGVGQLVEAEAETATATATATATEAATATATETATETAGATDPAAGPATAMAATLAADTDAAPRTTEALAEVEDGWALDRWVGQEAVDETVSDSEAAAFRWRLPVWQLPRVPTVLLWIYGLGAAGVALRLVLGGWRLRRLLRRATVCSAADERHWRRVAPAIPHRARLLISDDAPHAFCLSGTRPTLVLPSTWTCASPDALAGVLRHEAAHLNRGDAHVHLGLAALSVMWWFHPGFWWVRRRTRFACEVLADDVAATSMNPHRYARGLLELARSMPSRSLTFPAPGALQAPSDFSRRMTMLLRRTSPLEARPSRSFRCAVGACTLLAAGSGALVRAQSEEEPPPPPPRELAQPEREPVEPLELREAAPVASLLQALLSPMGDEPMSAEAATQHGAKLREMLDQLDALRKSGFTANHPKVQSTNRQMRTALEAWLGHLPEEVRDPDALAAATSQLEQIVLEIQQARTLSPNEFSAVKSAANSLTQLLADHPESTTALLGRWIADASALATQSAQQEAPSTSAAPAANDVTPLSQPVAGSQPPTSRPLFNQQAVTSIEDIVALVSRYYVLEGRIQQAKRTLSNQSKLADQGFVSDGELKALEISLRGSEHEFRAFRILIESELRATQFEMESLMLRMKAVPETDPAQRSWLEATRARIEARLHVLSDLL